MRARTQFLAAILLFGFVFPGSVYGASTPSTPRSVLEDATVNVYCRIKVSGRTYSVTGSGVYIHESGVILTNAHVGQYFLFGTSSKRTKADCSVREGSPARDRYDASLVYLSNEWSEATTEATKKKQPTKGTGKSDFALLQIVPRGKKKLPNAFPALGLESQNSTFKDGEAAMIGGYPAGDLSFKQVQKNLKAVIASTTITAIQSFERPHQDLLTLSPSAASASGVSGGPVAAEDELLGIVVTVEGGGSTKSERSLRAITLSYIDRAFREETGVSLKEYLANKSLLHFDPASSPFGALRATIEKTLRNTRG